MSEVWFTADTHFGHSNIIKYCLRPFLSSEEQDKARLEPRGKWKVSRETTARHDEALLEAINDRVFENDQLWILGDFCLGKAAQAKIYVEKIRCQNLHFIWGNHDHPSIGPLFNSAQDQKLIKVKGQEIWLNHYPMRSWDKRFHGSWSLYGHVHDRLARFDQQQLATLTRDVGVDACGYCPISFDQLGEYMKPRMVAFQEMRQRIVAGESLPDDCID